MLEATSHEHVEHRRARQRHQDFGAVLESQAGRIDDGVLRRLRQQRRQRHALHRWAETAVATAIAHNRKRAAQTRGAYARAPTPCAIVAPHPDATKANSPGLFAQLGRGLARLGDLVPCENAEPFSLLQRRMLTATITAARVAAFARAVGADATDTVDPVLVAAVGMPAVSALLVDPRLALSMLRVTNDAVEVAVVGAVHVDDVVTYEADVVSVDESGGGGTVTVRVRASTARGLAQTSMVTITARPSRAGRGPLPTPSPAPTSWRIGDVVTAARVKDGCVAFDDDNPVYVAADVARLAGLPAPMAPWLLAFAIAARHMRAPWTKAHARWTWPLLHDDTIVVAGGDDGTVVVDNAAGRRVIEATFVR